jgi:hypothetical protein
VPPDELSVHAQTTARGHRVRRRVGDGSERIDHHQSFTDTWRLPRLHPFVRERTFGDHVEERVTARRVGLLEVAHASSAERHPFADENRGHAIADADGDRRTLHAAAVYPSRLDLRARERSDRLRRVLREKRGADVIVRVERLRRQRTDLRQGKQVLIRVVGQRSKEEKVGEREIPEHLPHGDQPMEVLDLSLGDPAGAGAEFLEERRHGSPIVAVPSREPVRPTSGRQPPG